MRNHGKNRVRLLFLVVALTGIAGYGGTLLAGEPEKPRPVVEEKILAHLYFGHPDGTRLMAEQRKIAGIDDPALFSKNLVQELINGPLKGGTPLIPEGTQILAFFIGPDKTAFVDLSKKIREGLPGSIRQEALATYSLVNTLALSVEEIDAVQILINGQQAKTLAGHVDISRPLAADILVIK